MSTIGTPPQNNNQPMDTSPLSSPQISSSPSSKKVLGKRGRDEPEAPQEGAKFPFRARPHRSISKDAIKEQSEEGAKPHTGSEKLAKEVVKVKPASEYSNKVTGFFNRLGSIFFPEAPSKKRLEALTNLDDLLTMKKELEQLLLQQEEVGGKASRVRYYFKYLFGYEKEALQDKEAIRKAIQTLSQQIEGYKRISRGELTPNKNKS